MDIWNLLLVEISREMSTSERAWSYTENGFKYHPDLNSLNNSDFLAAIVLNDILIQNEIEVSNLSSNNFGEFTLLIDKGLDEETRFYLQNYWTLIMKIKLKNKETPFIFVHMASSLDGKVATNNGHSKWIGNQENLIHAHRLRAIVDGIMVGANTVRNDRPTLNVRHVEGVNPVRLILSNKSANFDELQPLAKTDTYLLRNKEYESECTSFPFDKKLYFDGKCCNEKLHNLALSLKKSGINSILIEGGPCTVSSFLSAGLVDMFQLHFAPIILGSGKDFVQLKEISEINQALTMSDTQYTPMGNSIMVTGNL